MKKLNNVLFALVCLAAFTSNAKSQAGRAVGGAKDAHGCLVSTGSTWSVIKNACVQVFNAKDVKLLPVTNTGSTVYATFVIFNADKTKAEFFFLSKHL